MRTLTAAIAVLAMMAALPAGAQAFGVQVTQASPSNATAGAHSDFGVQMSFTDGSPRDITLQLPAGLVGDTVHTAKCSLADFRGNRCKLTSQVGSLNAAVRILNATVNVPGTIFLIQPEGDEIARLGMQLRPPVGDPQLSESPVIVRADGGLTSSVTNLPNQQFGQSISVTALAINLQGLSTGGPFMRNPTGCADPVTVVGAVSYDNEAATSSGSYRPLECEKQPFAPAVTLDTGGKGRTDPGTFPEAAITLKQSVGEAGIKTSTVVLPAGLRPNPAVLGKVCPTSSFTAGTCPAASQVGIASAASPILHRPLTGPVRLVQGTPLPQLAVQLSGVIDQTLLGQVSLTAGGRLATTFNDIPDLPITQFRLALAGGESGLLTTARDLCAVSNPPINGVAISQAGQSASLTETPDVAGCNGDVAGGPKNLKRARVKASLTRLSGTPRLGLSIRALRSARLKRVDVTLPKGVRLARRGTVRVKGATVRVRSSRKLRVSVRSSSGARSVRLAIRRGVRVTRSARSRAVKQTVRARFTVRFTGLGSSYTTRAKLRARR